MSLTRILVFFTIVLGIVGGVHFYFWVRLVRDTRLPPPYRPWLTGVILVLAACLPLPLLIARRLEPATARYLAWPAYLWMGFMFFLFVLLLAGDLIRSGAWVTARLADPEGLSPARRTFLARLLGGMAGLGAGATGAFAVRQALRGAVVKEVDVRLARLPAESHGTTIVQLTDMHVGPTIGRAFVEDIVRRTNALTPDIIAITGDLVDGKVEALRDAVAPLAELRAKHGVFFVTGNHEYFSGAGPWLEELTRLGIQVLDNRRVTIGGEGGFDLAGVNDYTAARLHPEHRSDVGAALLGRNPEREVVLLAHQPRNIGDASRLDVGLQLSGHTHGGQLWPFNFFVKLQQPYVAGLHRHGRTQVYVSPGTGYWGPPMRLGTQAEITKIRLLRETA
ncbi:MAG TPA: metallophosphoesterase [Polyangia bacterium]